MKHFSANSTKTARPAANQNSPAKPNTLPVCTSPATPRPSLMRNKIPASFLSQLIAERNRLAIQRPKRRAPVSLATRAYNTARRIAIKRMPTGFTYQNEV